MADERMALAELREKGLDGDLLREMGLPRAEGGARVVGACRRRTVRGRSGGTPSAPMFGTLTGTGRSTVRRVVDGSLR